MKRVYFVRHGETVANQTKSHQNLSDPLTPEGERQALRVAERTTTLPIDLCIASDALRARQTAAAIEAELKMPFIYSSLFREWAVPSSLVGKSEHSEESIAYARLVREHDDAWHYEDEENFVDIKRRAEEAFAFLLAQDADDILVVTHGQFLKFLMSSALLQDALTSSLWHRVGVCFKTSNTGITVVMHTGERWRLLTWNDHAHFGENTFVL